MPRWQPDAAERLAAAALELFAERGYENTTVVDIAERAGLTKSTFFRHYSDKREVLFAADQLTSSLADAIAAAPPEASAWQCVAVALGAVGDTAFPEANRHKASRRRSVIAAHPELQEREALKGLTLADAMSRALQRRGIGRPVACVVAHLGLLALTRAYEQWTDAQATGRGGFGDLAKRELALLRKAASAN